MRSNTIYATAAILLTMASVAACSNNKSEASTIGGDSIVVSNNSSNSDDSVLKHLAVDKHRIMPYVICSEQAVDSLLAIADTAVSRTGTYQLKDLDMGDAYINDGIQNAYNDTIPTVVALFATYARIINSGMDEASAAFVWHEVATLQMKDFFEKSGGQWDEPDSSEAIFRIIDGMMATYGCGNQHDMNFAAWRSILPIDYRLIEVYKQLMDLCQDAHLARLVNDDYMYTLNTFRKYCSSSDEWYSDLPRQQGEMFQMLLFSKLKHVQRLVNQYKQKRISISSIRKSLKQHRIIWLNQEKTLTISILKED